MNIEEIGEPIRVIADFSGGGAVPVKFRWGRQTCEISTVNGKWIDRSGDGYALHYSVQVGDETYYIHFDSAEVQWWLDRIVLDA